MMKPRNGPGATRPILIGAALSCTASSLALTACARVTSEERRSKVVGLVSAAGSLDTLLVPLTTQAALRHQAWQYGVLLFLILAVAMLPASSGFILLFAAAMGMLRLGVAPLVSGLVAEMFGTRYMATLLGIAFVMHQVWFWVIPG